MKLRFVLGASLASLVLGLGVGALTGGSAGCSPVTPDAAAAERGTAVQKPGSPEGTRHGGPPAEATPPIAVRLAPVAAGPVDRPIRGTGTVRFKSEADLSFKVGGVVSAVLVEEGAKVRKGQVLARLDP